MAEQQSTTAPAAIPEGYMRNPAGHLVPRDQVRQQDLLRDAVASKLAADAIEINRLLREFKALALGDIADLVKISAEDLELLWPGRSAASFAEDVLRRGARLVVVTDGGEAAHGWTAGGHHASATPPKVTVIDTVGAGDTFQAALIAQLQAHPDGPGAALDALDLAGLEALLGYAARAAAITCSRRGADLPRAAELSMS